MHTMQTEQHVNHTFLLPESCVWTDLENCSRAEMSALMWDPLPGNSASNGDYKL